MLCAKLYKNTFSFTPIASLLNVMHVLLCMTLCNLRPYFRLKFCCFCTAVEEGTRRRCGRVRAITRISTTYSLFAFIFLKFDPTVHIKIFYTNLLVHSINIVETLKRSSFLKLNGTLNNWEKSFYNVDIIRRQYTVYNRWYSFHCCPKAQAMLVTGVAVSTLEKQIAQPRVTV